MSAITEGLTKERVTYLFGVLELLFLRSTTYDLITSRARSTGNGGVQRILYTITSGNRKYGK
jgi:hypothetical protein